MTTDLSDVPLMRRRSFLASAATLLGVATGGAVPAAAAAAPRAPEDWMDELRGKHRTVFDLAAHRGGKPLGQAKNFLDAWRDAFHVPEREVNLVIGVHGDGIPIVLEDALWARYRIGHEYDVPDPATHAPAVRNLFSAANVVADGPVTAEQSVEALQARGVRFLVCANTIANASKKLSATGLGTPEEIAAALRGGLLPKVILVPAMVVALSQLQERGLSYTKVS